MASWFDENAPDQQDWFAQNAPTPIPVAVRTPEGGFQFLPRSGTQTDVAEAREVAQQPLPFVQGLEEAVTGAIPRSVGEAGRALGEMTTPAVGGIEDLIQEPQQIAGVYQGLQEGKSLSDAVKDVVGQAKTYPEYDARDWGRLFGQLGMAGASALPFVGPVEGAVAGALQPRVPMEMPEAPPSVAPEASVAEAIKALSQQPAAPPVALPVEPQPQIITPELGSPFQQPPPPSVEIPPEDVKYTGQAPPAPPTTEQPAPVPSEGVGANVKGFEQTYGPSEIPAGETITPEDAWDAAAQRARAGQADPYGFVDRAKTGAITPEEMGDLIYEHQRLVKEAGAAEGTPRYDELYARAKAFAENVVKPAENAWHRSGQTMQIAVQPDFTSVTGISEAATRMERELSASEMARARELARENKNANNGVQANGEKLLKGMDKEYSRGAKRPPKTAEQLRNELAGTDPCVLI